MKYLPYIVIIILVLFIYESAKCKDGNLDDLLKELVPVIKTLEKNRTKVQLNSEAVEALHSFLFAFIKYMCIYQGLFNI